MPCWVKKKRKATSSHATATAKGLGEIGPDEFVHFIGPDIRLEQVTLNKTDQVDMLLEYYMGNNTMERQNFIIDNLVIEEDRVEDLEEVE